MSSNLELTLQDTENVMMIINDCYSSNIHLFSFLDLLDENSYLYNEIIETINNICMGLDENGKKEFLSDYIVWDNEKSSFFFIDEKHKKQFISGFQE